MSSDNSSHESTNSDNSSNVSTNNDLYCYERLLPSSTLVTSCIKEKRCWNLATHHLRREIGNHCSREILWMKSTVVLVDDRTRRYENAAVKEMDKEVQDLFNRATSIDTVDIYWVWEQKCDECLDFLQETCRNSKRQRTSTGVVNASIAQVARLEGLRNVLQQRFEHVGSDRVESQKSGFSWLEIETAFINRVLVDIVIDRIRDNLQRHDCLKVNTIFNGEFVADAKRSAKSITTKNYELFNTSDLREWYDEHVMDDILAALEEFQERDSGWALSRISNLIVNVNKFNPMHAGCWVELPREIMLKKEVINVRSMDNACFAWSVVAALYPAE
ncbi:hypothetical protein ALC57_05335, partial [Trachymyrmex cornetzi]